MLRGAPTGPVPQIGASRPAYCISVVHRPRNPVLLHSLLTAIVIAGSSHPTPLHVPGDGLPTAQPAEVGMSAARLAKINDVIARGIRAGVYPGASVFVGRQGFGHLTWSRNSPLVVPDRTIYDLASLTKVIDTT